MPRFLQNERVLALILILAVSAAFAPLLAADFTLWDDPQTLYNNPLLNPPSLRNLAHIWNPRHPQMDLYVPVTYTVWSAVAAVARVPETGSGVTLNPWLFHGLNLTLHLLATLVTFAVLRRLVPNAPAAAFGAALFALHPVQVESVGWASGTKDVLWGLLGLLAVWQYVHFAQSQGPRESSAPATATDARGRIESSSPGLVGTLNYESGSATEHSLLHYGLATAALVLAMLCKPTAIVIPAAAGLIDLILLRRPLKRVMLALLPWVLLTIPIIIEGRFAQPVTGLHQQHVPLHLRPLIAADALAFYFYKLFLPIQNCILYDHSPKSVLAHGWHHFTWIVPATVALAALILRRKVPWLIAAIGIFWLGVAPVLGLLPFDFQYFSTVADHYLYFAMLGPAMAVTFLMSKTWENHRSVARPVVLVSALFLLGILAGRSFVQSATWNDSITLFEHAVKVNPRSGRAYVQLGYLYYVDRTRPGLDSLKAYEKAVQVDPDEPSGHVNLGTALAEIGRLDEAELQYRFALALAPGDPAALQGLEQITLARARYESNRSVTRPNQ